MDRHPCRPTVSPATCAAFLRVSECLRISSADLRDYFYLFTVTPDRLQRNLVRGSLSLSEARWVFGRDCSDFADRRRRVRVAISTLGMGDCCACEFAQAAHVGVLRHYGLLCSQEMLLPSHPFPRSLISVGIVIDDLVVARAGWILLESAALTLCTLLTVRPGWRQIRRKVSLVP